MALVDFGFGRFGLVFGSGLVLVGSIRFGLVWYLVLVQLSWLSFWSAQICRGLVLVMSEQFFFPPDQFRFYNPPFLPLLGLTALWWNE